MVIWVCSLISGHSQLTGACSLNVSWFKRHHQGGQVSARRNYKDRRAMGQKSCQVISREMGHSVQRLSLMSAWGRAACPRRGRWRRGGDGKAWILLGLNGLNSGLTEHHSTEETARREGSGNYFINQGIGRIMLSLKALAENLFHAFHLASRVASKLWHSLTYRHTTSISASVIAWPLLWESMCFCLFSSY